MATRKKKDQVEPILHHGYKGFDKDLKCNGKQYVLGETFEEPEAKLCERGLHYCEHPLDCLGYYAPGRGSRYAQVIAENPEEETGDDSKRVTKKLTIGSELGLHGVIDAAVEFVFARVEPAKTNSNSGFKGAASNSGDGGAASNSGFKGAASNSGFKGAASNSGDWGAAFNNGYEGRAETDAEKSIAVSCGYQGIARGNLGAWLVLAERADDGEIKHVRCGKVDGKVLLPGVFYQLKNKKFVVVD